MKLLDKVYYFRNVFEETFNNFKVTLSDETSHNFGKPQVNFIEIEIVIKHTQYRYSIFYIINMINMFMHII